MQSNSHYELMARYNQWMNEKLYSVCAQISDVDRRADRGAFFKSIHSTLNHILWGDRMWLARFTDHPRPTTAIGVDLYEDFDELWTQRQLTDHFIADWARSLSSEWLNAPFSWRSGIDGQERTQIAWILVSHLFNHQTHHRGQITTLLSQLGYDIGSTDLPWMPTVPSDGVE